MSIPVIRKRERLFNHVVKVSARIDVSLLLLLLLTQRRAHGTQYVGHSMGQITSGKRSQVVREDNVARHSVECVSFSRVQSPWELRTRSGRTLLHRRGSPPESRRWKRDPQPTLQCLPRENWDAPGVEMGVL